MTPSDALRTHRDAIRGVVAAHRASHASVSGSVLRGLDTERSDRDSGVDPTPDTTVFDIGAIRHELHHLLGLPVDVLSPQALPDRCRAAVMAQAMAV